MTITQHPRMPAIITILCSCLLCAVLSLIFADAPQHTDFNQLAKAVNETDDSKVWLQYAQALKAQGRYQHAVQVYQKILKREPYHNAARYEYALALAQGDDEEAYFKFMGDLVLNAPQMATQLFARPESQRFLKQERFRLLAHEARVQAVD